ncbi:MAG: glycosyltransferase family A protein [Reichenbachiella sp.]|uniref:glycosyltransferase family 2 protein n=1 Tax=Reichenbachiella sp. TaxID=2184521 RepID=UPI0032642CC7
MKTSHSPLVSVIIPVYNGEKYIEESIQSVISQTYTNTEIIVVDDGSTDNTAFLVKKFPVQYYYQENQGQSAALNFGISKSTGTFLSFNDADDLWTEGKLEDQMNRFKEISDLEASFGLVKQFISPELNADQAGKIHCPAEPMKGMGKTTMLILKESFERVGNFNTTVKIGDFIEWFASAQRKNIKTDMIDHILAYRRLHTTNMSLQNKDERTSFAQILKRHLDAQKK